MKKVSTVINGKKVFAAGIASSLEELVEKANLKGDIVTAEPLGFELIGLSSGGTTFTLSLMHDGHADFVSLPVSVTVE